MFVVANSQLSHTVSYLEQLEARGKVVLTALEADVANGSTEVKQAAAEVKEKINDVFSKVTAAKTAATGVIAHIESLGKAVVSTAAKLDPKLGATGTPGAAPAAGEAV